jgi:hypothetical protein
MFMLAFPNLQQKFVITSKYISKSINIFINQNIGVKSSIVKYTISISVQRNKIASNVTIFFYLKAYGPCLFHLLIYLIENPLFKKPWNKIYIRKLMFKLLRNNGHNVNI